MDDFLGLYISPRNRLMNSLLIGPGLPGWHDGQSDGRLGIQSGVHQQIQGKTQPALHEAG